MAFIRYVAIKIVSAVRFCFITTFLELRNLAKHILSLYYFQNSKTEKRRKILQITTLVTGAMGNSLEAGKCLHNAEPIIRCQ
jgi:exosortase/archaeosortase